MSKKLRLNLYTKIVVIVLFGASIGGNIWLYKKYYNLKKNPPSADEVQKSERERIVAKVGKLYKLPQGEDPDPFATVKDKELLKGQDFFKDAENGDYVLFYKNAKVAILYREKEDRIINVGPLSESGTNQSSQVKLTVFGTEAQNTEAKTKLSGIQNLAYSTAAPKSSYSQILVVDIAGNNKDLASQIASKLGGQIGDFPSSETKPADSQIAIFMVTAAVPAPTDPATQP
jgi:hypothetical protein